MESYYTDDTCNIYHGDVRDCLRALPDGSVQCCVTSPPYWALRDYGVAGQLGLEPTPEEYIANMVEVFREVRRVLRSDGTLWLNIGDSYATRPCGSLKAKDMIGIPWMLAFALRADGWYLRSEVIWAKKSPMPEAVKDRPTKSHEPIFLLTPNRRYYYDHIGSQEETTGNAHSRGHGVNLKAKQAGYINGQAAQKGVKQNSSFSAAVKEITDRRNMRTIWPLSSFALKEAHFAAFPPELVRRCLTAGVSDSGSCRTCGMPWDRVIEKHRTPTRPGTASKVPGGWAVGEGSHSPIDHQQPGSHRKTLKHDAMATSGATPFKPTEFGNRDPQRHVTSVVTTGWKQGCDCPAGDPVPCTVLDPFHGAGTTWKVCQRLGLNYIGTELNSEYIDLSVARPAVHFPHERKKSKRIKKVKPDGQRELFA